MVRWIFQRTYFGGNMEIKIDYDGTYPNLCSGHLFVTIDDEKWDFGEYCLSSGGYVTFDNDWNEYVTDGPWTVTFPKDFPDELKEIVEGEINMKIPWGCCGGCV